MVAFRLLGSILFLHEKYGDDVALKIIEVITYLSQRLLHFAPFHRTSCKSWSSIFILNEGTSP